MQPNTLHLGASWYPEHWPEERWPEDVRLMREAGFTVARLGEFAWSTMEPEPGALDLAWLERAVELLARQGLDSVLGTPTAAPPAWLTRMHPDMLAVDEYGRRAQHGNRCHYCVTSPDLHEAARRIAGAMAERLGRHERVIGWQIDNEFNRVCFCDRCRQAFQQFLRGRYGSLSDLNRRWSAAYWSQTYTAWEEVPIPIGPHNPALMLEFRRFVTACYRAFQKAQIDAMRPHIRPDAWITHNFMYWFELYDHYELSEDLDIASWDWYVGTGHTDYTASGAAHDVVRGFKRKNFWLIETQPGNVNWHAVNNALNRGETRANAFHAVAHGADAVLYWQWRSALGGQEQYHGTLVDQSGQPRPFYEEAREIGRDFAAVGHLLAGAHPVAQAAILNSYESRWSVQWQRHHRDFDYVKHLTSYYRPLAAQNIPCDIVSPDAPLDEYRLVVAPALVMLSEERAARLATFAERGGHLVLTVRTGMKDDDNALLPLRQPGFLREAAGAEVEEYYALDVPASVAGEGIAGTSQLWAERIAPLPGAEVEVLARYGPSNGWLDGHPAITAHRHGAGRVYLVGVYLDDTAQAALMARIAADAGLSAALEAPPGVETRRMEGPAGEAYLVINHTRAPQTVALAWPARDHIAGADVSGALELEPYGVAVLTR